MIVLRIKAIAADRGMNLSDLADKVDMKRTQFSRITQNKQKTISYELLEKLCVVLDCTPGQLIEFRRDGQAGE